MGTKMAPAYANIFMGQIEPKLIALAPTNIAMWKRFIDDIFIIWMGNESDLKKFINRAHPTIKFTHEYSDRELTFLDTTIYKGPDFETTGILDIKTHIKPTNKQQLYTHKLISPKKLQRSHSKRGNQKQTQEKTPLNR